MMYRMAAALALVAGASGCVIYIDDPGDNDGPIVDPGYPTDPDYPYPDLPPSPPSDCLLEAPRFLDCNEDAGYEIDTYRPGSDSETKLHLLGVYGTPYGQGYVKFAQPGSNVLALSAYEATEWIVELGEGASLEKIVVVGHEAQTVYGPEGVPVEVYSYDQGSELFGCGYSYPYEGGGCDTDALIAVVESITNLPLAVFDGCYQASQLQVEPGGWCGEPPPPPDCSEDKAILDCDAAAGYEVNSYRADSDSDTTLHLVGVYETYEYEASVYFDKPGSNVLALSAYAATQWNVELAPGASLDKIVVVGYEAQFVKGPEGVPVEIYDHEGQDSPLAGCGYALPYNGGGCDTNALIATVESITGLTLSRFDGCYRASAIQVGPSTCEPGPGPPKPSSVILDCAAESYASRSESDGRPAVYLGAVYETRSDHSAGYHPTGEAYVDFALAGDNVLALSAYEPAHWIVRLAPGASLQKVVLIGHHTQTAEVPEGVALEVHDYESTDSPLAACGYALPYNGGGCDTDQLIANVETITGLPVTGFDGCYNATTFAYFE